MDIVYALLIALGLRHEAPAVVYHAPVKTLPLVVENDPAVVLGEWQWGSDADQ